MSILPNVPVVANLVAGDIVEIDTYYTYDLSDDQYVGNALNVFNYDDKISVGGGSGGAAYTVEIQLGGAGDDDVLFSGTVDSTHVIPKAMALECDAFFYSQVVDLSAGPMSYSRFRQLGAAADKSGAYLLTMKGSAFVADLAQMDQFNGIAMVDIASGVAVLKHNIPIHAGYVEIAGGGLDIDETLNYAHNMTIVKGDVNIGAGAIATYTGILNDLSKIEGKGTLDIFHGDLSIGEGAELQTQTWISKGSSSKYADDYLDSALNYAGNFIVGADTDFTLHKSSSLTVKKIQDINGLGGTFTMGDWDPVYEGDELIDVLGGVAKGESFNIGLTDVLQLGAPTQFHGVIDSMTVGANASSSQAAHAGGEVALDGIWNFVSVANNSADTETIVTMKDTANNLLAHIDFLGTHSASYFEFFDQLKGVTPTTVITPLVPPPII